MNFGGNGMQDNFYEQFVGANDSAAYKVVGVIMKISIVFGVLYMLSSAFLGLLGIILTILCAIIYFSMIILKRKIYLDYEYDFTNGEIDIVSIGDKIKRKVIITFDIKEIGILAAKDSDEIRDFSNRPNRILKCYPKDTDDKIYTIILIKSGKSIQIEFVPDKEFLNLCFQKNPRAVKKGIIR